MPHDFHRDRLLGLGRKVGVRVALQLEGQNGLKSSGSIVDGALKLVKPVGLSHTVEGGTNRSGLWSIAILTRSIGIQQDTSSQGGGETGKEFEFLPSQESLEKRPELESDASEECEVLSPATSALDSG